MVVNSTRDLINVFTKITKFSDLPKKFEISHTGNFINMYHGGDGVIAGGYETAYFGDDAEILKIKYTKDGDNINVTDIKFTDSEVSIANSVPSKPMPQ